MEKYLISGILAGYFLSVIVNTVVFSKEDIDLSPKSKFFLTFIPIVNNIATLVLIGDSIGEIYRKLNK